VIGASCSKHVHESRVPSPSAGTSATRTHPYSRYLSRQPGTDCDSVGCVPTCPRVDLAAQNGQLWRPGSVADPPDGAVRRPDSWWAGLARFL